MLFYACMSFAEPYFITAF